MSANFGSTLQEYQRAVAVGIFRSEAVAVAPEEESSGMLCWRTSTRASWRSRAARRRFALEKRVAELERSSRRQRQRRRLARLGEADY